MKPVEETGDITDSWPLCDIRVNREENGTTGMMMMFEMRRSSLLSLEKDRAVVGSGRRRCFGMKKGRILIDAALAIYSKETRRRAGSTQEKGSR